MTSILSEMLRFLRDREETLTTLTKIKSEIDEVGKNASNTNLATRLVSLGAGISSVVCMVATPFTAGASAPVAAGLAVLSGTSAAVSVGVTVVRHFKETGLMKSASDIIEKDQRAKDRLRTAANSIKELASISSNTIRFLENAAQLGLTTTNEVLKLAGTAKAAEVATKAAQVFEKANKIAKIAGPVLVFVSIPLDIMGIISEMLERGNMSEASKQIQQNIQELQNEYQTVRSQYGQIKSILNI